jgi:hypothetical protein
MSVIVKQPTTVVQVEDDHDFGNKLKPSDIKLSSAMAMSAAAVSPYLRKNEESERQLTHILTVGARGGGRLTEGGGRFTGNTYPPPPPLPKFVMKSGLIALANVAVNTILTSKVIFLFLEHIYVCPFTQASSVVNTNLRHVNKSNERNF